MFTNSSLICEQQILWHPHLFPGAQQPRVQTDWVCPYCNRRWQQNLEWYFYLWSQIDFNVYNIQPPNMFPLVFFNNSALIPVLFVWLNWFFLWGVFFTFGFSWEGKVHTSEVNMTQRVLSGCYWLLCSNQKPFRFNLFSCQVRFGHFPRHILYCSNNRDWS